MFLSHNNFVKYLYAGLLLVVFLFTEGCNNSQSIKNPSDLIPKGYLVFEKILGDLNNDGISDSIFIVKNTNKKGFVVDENGEEIDRNRRGIMIFVSENDRWELKVKNLGCFSSENEDGGVYFPPELYVHVEEGNLYVHYGHGRYGYWKYTFKLNESHFELIGYISSSSHGPIIESEIILNYLTKKKLERVNVNENSKNDEDAIFEENWSEIELNELIKLSKIVDFDVLDLP